MTLIFLLEVAIVKLTKIYGSGKHTEDFITFEADADILLHNYDEYEKYVKGCEAMVRGDDRYKACISRYRAAGFDHCAILGNVIKKGGDKIRLEMHHGPIFNLFDICDIALKASLLRGNIQNLTTFDIADLVLTEHELDNIMVVFLSKTPHKGAHFNIFIDVKATVGRIDRFIDRWHDGMEDEHYEYIDRYLEACKNAEGNTTDNGLFETAEQLKKFK